MPARPLLLCASLVSLMACSTFRPRVRSDAPGAETVPPAAQPAPETAGAGTPPGEAAVPAAGAEGSGAAPTPGPESEELLRLRDAVVRRAGERVGRPRVGAAGIPDDCSGLVRHAYRAVDHNPMPRASLPGENAVSGMYREAQRRNALDVAAAPAPGDIVFFRETYDRNRDGKRNDGLTHVGIVESVEEDGTVVFIHRGVRGVMRSRYNTAHPEQHQDGRGRVLNDWIRARSRRLRAYFAGELYAGFASVRHLLAGAAPEAPAVPTPVLAPVPSPEPSGVPEVEPLPVASVHGPPPVLHARCGFAGD